MRPAALLLALAGGCALSDPLDQAFGPDGRTLREAVASFPEERRRDFDLFTRRCSTCHSLNDPLAAHIPEGGWRAQIRVMQRKPGAAISDADAGRIASLLEFLTGRRRGS